MLWYRPESSNKLVGEFFGTGSVVRNKMIKNWGVIGGIAAVVAAGVYVLWGPITDRKKRKRALSSDEPVEDDALDAGCLLDVLRLYRWHISSFEEQDAHELFHVLTSSLEEERDHQPKVTHLFDMQCLENVPDQDEKTMTCRSRAPLHPIPSLWKFQHPFHGRLTSNMSCKRCELQSPVRYDSFESLSLSIPLLQWGRSISLDQCLQHFISSETIKEVECGNCTQLHQDTTKNGQVLESQRTTFVKQLKLGKLPQCLCIHLQRLTWSSEGTPIKRQEHVQFSEYLSMDRYKHSTRAQRSQRLKPAPTAVTTQTLDDCSERPTPNGTDARHHNNNRPFSNGSCSSVFPQSLCEKSQLGFTCDYSSAEYLFQLTAVLVHHGDMHSGHFITYRRSPASPRCSSPFSPQWLWVSDDSVRKASLHEVLSSNAYMLFYERVRRLSLSLCNEE
ncbi:ubiquitin carboxyl-terminal hydrolase 30 isoform X2 [Gouania willdenowi]|uniref:ubiquitin carboxyl-terminal hydrolase 30 isoform X2 n=1 Tax=Gouania willdenowi TaxID=441366 RepID=UPI001056020C|nr:ubiquitin carboxyl-terminal hydrolase 30 isoform X2 [Gouania willdenowi]